MPTTKIVKEYVFNEQLSFQSFLMPLHAVPKGFNRERPSAGLLCLLSRTEYFELYVKVYSLMWFTTLKNIC